MGKNVFRGLHVNDSEWVAFSRDEGGKEQHQIYKARLDPGAESNTSQLPPTNSRLQLV